MRFSYLAFAFYVFANFWRICKKVKIRILEMKWFKNGMFSSGTVKLCFEELQHNSIFIKFNFRLLFLKDPRK